MNPIAYIQNHYALPWTTEAEDEATIQRVFNRQIVTSVKVASIARALHEARSIWVGASMTWEELTPQQKASKVREAQELVTGDDALDVWATKKEQESR